MWDLIVSVPDHCLSSYLELISSVHSANEYRDVRCLKVLENESTWTM